LYGAYKSQILQGSAKVSLAYDAAGRRTSVTLPNLIKASCTYDNASQVVGIVYTKPDASLLGDLRYSYDSAGRRIAISGSLARVSLPPAVSPAVYDQANRLTKLNVQ